MMLPIRKGGLLRCNREIFEYLVDPFDDEMHLLRCAVILAGTSHLSQSAEVEFRPCELLSCFKGKDMGLAGDVLLLEGSQKRGWNLHPEESFHSGGNCLPAQEFVNPLEVRDSDFVDQIRLHLAFAPTDRSDWKATQKASTTE